LRASCVLMAVALAAALVADTRAFRQGDDTVVLLQDPSKNGLEADEDGTASEKKAEEMKKAKLTATMDIKGMEEKATEQMKVPAGTVGLDSLQNGMNQLGADMAKLKTALPKISKEKKTEMDAKIAKEEKKAGLPAEVTAAKDQKGGGVNIQEAYAKTERDMQILSNVIDEGKPKAQKVAQKPEKDAFEEAESEVVQVESKALTNIRNADAQENIAKEDQKGISKDNKADAAAEKKAAAKMPKDIKAAVAKADEHEKEEEAGAVEEDPAKKAPAVAAGGKGTKKEEVEKEEEAAAEAEAPAKTETSPAVAAEAEKELKKEKEDEAKEAENPEKKEVDLSAYTGPSPTK